MSSSVTDLIAKINQFILNPIIGLLFALALILFLWGGVEFLMNAAGQDGRETGKRHMVWGIIGIFVMVSVFGILKVLASTFGFCNQLPGGC